MGYGAHLEHQELFQFTELPPKATFNFKFHPEGRTKEDSKGEGIDGKEECPGRSDKGWCRGEERLEAAT